MSGRLALARAASARLDWWRSNESPAAISGGGGISGCAKTYPIAPDVDGTPSELIIADIEIVCHPDGPIGLLRSNRQECGSTGNSARFAAAAYCGETN